MIKPELIDGLFPKSMYIDLCDMLRSVPLKWGAKSHHSDDPVGHASWKPLHDHHENLADLRLQEDFHQVKRWWDFLGGTYLRDMVPVRVYANVHGYGMDGYFHTDSTRKGEKTCIIYCCDDWMYNWAGETVVLSYDKQTYWSFVPRINRAIIIPSDMEHCARGVSRACTVPRVTFMFKVRPERSSMFEALSKFLVKHNAMVLPHQKGTLHDHLMRVFELLRAKGCDYDTCVAGGLHSVYGTTVYKQQLFRPTEANRQIMRNEWGDKVELLVHQFSILEKRGMAMEKALADWAAPPISLCTIECANILDQGGFATLPMLKEFWDKRVP